MVLDYRLPSAPANSQRWPGEPSCHKYLELGYEISCISALTLEEAPNGQLMLRKPEDEYLIFIKLNVNPQRFGALKPTQSGSALVRLQNLLNVYT